MNRNKLGNLLLKNGKIATVEEVIKAGNQTDVQAMCLYDNVVLFDFSPKRKSYQKAKNWCFNHSGYLPNEQTVHFIYFHLTEINDIRRKLGLDEIPEDFLAWTTTALRGNGNYTHINVIYNFRCGKSAITTAESVVLDDCGTASPFSVFGEAGQE